MGLTPFTKEAITRWKKELMEGRVSPEGETVLRKRFAKPLEEWAAGVNRGVDALSSQHGIQELNPRTLQLLANGSRRKELFYSMALGRGGPATLPSRAFWLTQKLVGNTQPIIVTPEAEVIAKNFMKHYKKEPAVRSLLINPTVADAFKAVGRRHETSEALRDLHGPAGFLRPKPSVFSHLAPGVLLDEGRTLAGAPESIVQLTRSIRNATGEGKAWTRLGLRYPQVPMERLGDLEKSIGHMSAVRRVYDISRKVVPALVLYLLMRSKYMKGRGKVMRSFVGGATHYGIGKALAPIGRVLLHV